MVNGSVVIKRSPVVLIRTFVFIEILGFALYFFGVQLGNYKFQLYTQLSLSNFLSYPTAKLFLLSGAQLVITIYAFLHWHLESYILQPGMVSHERGVLFKKRKTLLLQGGTPVVLLSRALGKLFRYGDIRVGGVSPESHILLANISHPQKYLKVIARFAQLPEHEHAARPDAEVLLKQDEHEGLEFKSSLRFDYHTNQVNRELEKSVFKTVAAFLNSGGGYLVVGVSDKKEPVGLGNDYKTLGRQNSDGFENHFTQLFNKMLGPELRHRVRLWFPAVSGQDVCIVDVAPSAEPAYLKLDDTEHFYVRTGNVSTPLKLSEVEHYVRSRWPRRMAS